MSLTLIIYVGFEIRKKKAFCLCFRNKCSEHEIIYNWHSLILARSEFSVFADFKWYYFGYERLPKHDSRQGNHLGIFIILFKYLSKYTIFIIIRFCYSTTCENRASTNSCTDCAMHNSINQIDYNVNGACTLKLCKGDLCENVDVLK